jgi:hypothetical protein
MCDRGKKRRGMYGRPDAQLMTSPLRKRHLVIVGLRGLRTEKRSSIFMPQPNVQDGGRHWARVYKLVSERMAIHTTLFYKKKGLTRACTQKGHFLSRLHNGGVTPTQTRLSVYEHRRPVLEAYTYTVLYKPRRLRHSQQPLWPQLDTRH